jgi:lipoprotein-anchoring transpeptidase ErfK/SrfK
MSIEIARTRAGKAAVRACLALTLMFLVSACSQITSAWTDSTNVRPMKAGEVLTQRVLPDDETQTSVSIRDLNPKYKRQLMHYSTSHPVGTVVVDPDSKFLYLVMEGGYALRYGIGVSREGFGWSGTAEIARKARWPTWTPPAEMIRRQPELEQYRKGMEPGPGNPLGARALYLYQNGRDTLYRIHGTNEPSTIGQNVSSGCIRLLNHDVIDLFERVPVGARVVVLQHAQVAAVAASGVIYDSPSSIGRP